MIIELKGDLLESDCNVIIHCCNCFNTMGAGIAKSISKKWPEVYDADKKTIRGDKSKLGSFSHAITKDNKIIFNLYGQYYYGKNKPNIDYGALESGLIKIKEYLDKHSHSAFLKIGTYRLGCNRAGGNWNIVKEIIENIFIDCDINVYTL